MFKKLASIVLAATMMVCSVAFTASAAETDTDVVSADQSSAVGADGSSEVGASKVFKFDAKSAGWETAAGAGVFCHIYRVDGTGKWPGWKSKAEKCKYDAATGIATYDIQTGVKKGFPDLETIGPNNEWCIMFCTQSGAETYPVLLNSSCYGDTVYVPDKNKMYENNVDSEKKSVAARWKNHNLGAAKTITSTGKIQGDSLAYGETNETILASYLISYALDADKLKLTQDLVNQLNVSPVDVMGVVKYKQDEAVKSGSKKKDVADKETASIEKTLANCTDPTKGGQKVDEGDLKNVKAEKPGNSGNGGSSNGGSNSGSGSGSGSGSNSVSSGQETTIFFVFGGLMVVAAGVIFLSRKKREE